MYAYYVSFLLQYAEKCFIHKVKDTAHLLSVAEQLWKAVYRLVVFKADANAVHGEGKTCHLVSELAPQ